MAKGISGFVITDHAQLEMKRRGIDDQQVAAVLHSPEQRHSVRPGREVLQSRAEITGKDYLIRVFVDVDRNPAEVVTVYRSSKIEKYWRTGP